MSHAASKPIQVNYYFNEGVKAGIHVPGRLLMLRIAKKSLTNGHDLHTYIYSCRRRRYRAFPGESPPTHMAVQPSKYHLLKALSSKKPEIGCFLSMLSEIQRSVRHQHEYKSGIF